MIDNETTLIYCLGVLDSPDSVPYDAMMDAINNASKEELIFALQEMHLIAAGLVGNLTAVLNEDGGDVTPIEVVEAHFAILEASTEI